MRTWNEVWFPCPPAEAYDLACRVDRWPVILPHYRWVRFHRGGPEQGGLVEMAARRDFGRISWPVWWMSRMDCEPDRHSIRYLHLAGVTRGMNVVWQIEPAGSGSRVSILHEWDGGPGFCGPAAPTVGRRIVGPLFISHVADQTLKHLARWAAEEMIG